MKYILVGVVVLSAVGCAQVRVARWDGDRFTLCGNRIADRDDYERVASERCGGRAIAVSGGEEFTGSAIASVNASGRARATSLKENCTTYTCVR